MENHQHAGSPRGESKTRRLHYVWVPCLCSVKTIRVSSAIAAVVVFSFCLMMFNFKGKSFSKFSPLVPAAGDGFQKHLLQEKGKHMSFSQDSVPDVYINITMTKDGKTRSLPDAIIIGARKGGTRALLHYLQLHPRVATAQKEVHFFSDEGNYAKGLKWYQSQMPLTSPGELTVEKTPNYLISSVTPARVHRMNSSVRLLLTLRHPVTRAISDYTQIYLKESGQSRNQGYIDFATRAINSRTGDVNENYKALWISTYHLHVARWLELFPLKQIHFVDGDRLITEPLHELRKVETFLGLEPFYTEDVIYYNATKGFYCTRRPLDDGSILASCLGESKGREHPHVESWVKTKLNRYFYPHNEKLFEMIGQRFEWA